MESDDKNTNLKTPDAQQESNDSPSPPEETNGNNPQETPDKPQDDFPKPDSANSPEEISTEPPAAKKAAIDPKETTRPSNPEGTDIEPDVTSPKADADDSPEDLPEKISSQPPATEIVTADPQESTQPRDPQVTGNDAPPNAGVADSPGHLPEEFSTEPPVAVDDFKEISHVGDPQQTGNDTYDASKVGKADSLGAFSEETSTKPPETEESLSTSKLPESTDSPQTQNLELEMPIAPEESSHPNALQESPNESPDDNLPINPNITKGEEATHVTDAPQDSEATDVPNTLTDFPDSPEKWYSTSQDSGKSIEKPLKKNDDEETKRVSIDKIHRVTFKLAVLRKKQFTLAKKFKIMQSARPKYRFTDIEIKSELSERNPEKELLLYLYCENKRMEEKCFFSEMETKKCEAMTIYYTNKKEMALTVLNTVSAMGHNKDAETYLQSYIDNYKRCLKVAQIELDKHQKALVAKNKEYKLLAQEMVKCVQANGVSYRLKTKLQKDEALTDEEILQLSLDKCRETNEKLKTSIQTLGIQIDNLREHYFWKRDEFLTKLDSEFDPEPLVSIPVPVAVNGMDSNPPTPTGSMYDVILDKDLMVGRMARISKNTEDLIKSHNRLKDLRSRLISKTRYELPHCDSDELLVATSLFTPINISTSPDNTSTLENKT